MKANSSIVLKAILATYRLVLRCYPRAYQEQYAELMLQAAKDQLRYSKQHTVNQITFSLFKDISLSLPREHYAFESQQGFARKSFLLLLVLLTGLFVAREPLQQITTTSIEAVANTPESIQNLRYKEYSEYYRIASNEMLHSQDPGTVIAGADRLLEFNTFDDMPRTEAETISRELARAIASGANDPAVLFNAHRVCANNPTICNAQPLLTKMRSLHPQNAMTWLRHAAHAKEQANNSQQLAYLEQALEAKHYRNYWEINKLKQIEQMQRKPFAMPWYLKLSDKTSQFSPVELAIYLTIHSNVSTFPSCEYNLQINTPEVQIACQKMALKLLENQSLDFGQRYFALGLTKKSGDTRWLALAEQDHEMYKALYSLPSEPKLPSLQETHDALAQGTVDAMVKHIISENQ